MTDDNKLVLFPQPSGKAGDCDAYRLKHCQTGKIFRSGPDAQRFELQIDSLASHNEITRN